MASSFVAGRLPFRSGCRAGRVPTRASPPQLTAATLYVVADAATPPEDVDIGPRVRLLLQDGRLIADLVGVGGFPSAVAVHTGGTVATSAIVGSGEQLQEMIGLVERSVLAPR